jgi:hypothetical protein
MMSGSITSFVALIREEECFGFIEGGAAHLGCDGIAGEEFGSQRCRTQPRNCGPSRRPMPSIWARMHQRHE